MHASGQSYHTDRCDNPALQFGENELSEKTQVHLFSGVVSIYAPPVVDSYLCLSIIPSRSREQTDFDDGSETHFAGPLSFD